jgi:RNA polymerase sigma factor (sigma-70 family)
LVDESFFTDLYQTYYKRIYYVALHITKDKQLAEDAVQETFIKAISKMGSVKDQQKIGAWLSVVAARTAIDLVRKEKRGNVMAAEQLQLEGYGLKTEQNVEKDVEALLFNQYIYAAINQLSANYQYILKLKLQKGLKEQEIASLLHLNQNTVKTRLYRARQQLKLIVNRQDTA